MRRAAVLLAGVLLCAALLVAAPATAGVAAGCQALDYESALMAARDALAATPPDAATAAREVNALLGSDPAAAALRPVAADLSAQPPDTVDAGQRLEAMSSALAYAPGSTCNEDPSAARRTLHDVYGSPAFHHLDDVHQAGLLTTVLNFLGSLVSRVGGALGQVGALLVILAVAAVVALVVVRRLQRAAQTRAQVLSEPPHLGDDPNVEWRAATEAAAAGNFREAVRRAFRSALLDVAARDNVVVDPAWTTRELLERCHAGGDVLAALAGAAALFDRAWYSGAPVTSADWDLAAERCGALRRLARGRRVSIA